MFSLMSASNADFGGVVGEGWRMGEARIPGASFKGARLKGADLSYAAGPGATFEDADLTGAKFSKADLSGMNFVGARLTGASWGDATFDCKTVFPDGVRPPELGLSSWDASCPDKPGYAAGSNLPVSSCSPACHEWLQGDEHRSIKLRLSGRHSGTFLYSAGKAATPEACPTEATLFFYSAFGGYRNEALRIRDAMLSQGFCPVVEPIERHGRPVLSLPLEWNAAVGDIERIGFMTDQAFATTAMPAIERMMSSGDPLRIMTLSHIVYRRASNLGPLVPLALQVLGTPNPSSKDVHGGGSNDAATIQKLAEHVRGSNEVVRAVLSEADSSRKATPGYEAVLAGLTGPEVGVVALGRPSVCMNAAVIERGLHPWGKSEADDIAWMSNTARCAQSYPEPLRRALSDPRPLVFSHALLEWTSVATQNYGAPVNRSKQPPPAAEATLESVIALMRTGKVPDEFASSEGLPTRVKLYWPNRRFKPWQQLALALLALGKADEVRDRLRKDGADAKLSDALSEMEPLVRQGPKPR
jgi:hypothetical protein